MTAKQNSLYWREWGALARRCKAAGTQTPDRHELHMAAIGQVKSHLAFSNQDFDRVLAIFRSYSQPANLNGQIRQIRMPRTRLEHKIKIEQVRLLSVLLADDGLPAHLVTSDLDAAQAYVASVMRDRFGTEDITELSDTIRPRGSAPPKSDLECLRDTLDRCINDLRNRRGGSDVGWSIHDLRSAAGVKCLSNCRQCSRETDSNHCHSPARPHLPVQTA